MKAMILAAGRGERMRPLTDHTPKPLLRVNGKPLIQYHIEALKQADVESIVVNVAWLGEQLIDFLGDGSKFGIPIRISHEKDGALETAGGIHKALPLLGHTPFMVINGDVYTDYCFANLPHHLNGDMHLVLIKNPKHNPEGDFYFADNRIVQTSNTRLTFSGIGVYHPKIFTDVPADTVMPLRGLFQQGLQTNRISAEAFDGHWTDVGTPARLEALNSTLKNND